MENTVRHPLIQWGIDIDLYDHNWVMENFRFEGEDRKK